MTSIYSYDKQCTVWDWRCNEDLFERQDLIEFLNKIAKKWVFQLEKGKENGYLHYQGRMSLWKIKRGPELAKLIEGMNKPLFNYFRPTTSSEHKKEAFYCMKEDSKVEGPWKESDVIVKETKQLSNFLKLELRGYQKEILNWGNLFDERAIDLLYCPVGNIGKSIFAEYLEFIGMAEEIPPFRLMDDIFQWVCTRPKKKMYLVDMPRGMKKDKLGDFYAGIEVIKNGVCYDKRYTAKKERFDRPRVVIFTNTLPVLELMSLDRWNLWICNDDYNLEKFEPPEDSKYDCNEGYLSS